MSKNVISGPLGHLLTILKRPQTHRKQFFQTKYCFHFFCHIEPNCQKLCIYGENCGFRLISCPFQKAPLNSSKTKTFKNDIFCCFRLSLEPTCQKLRFYIQNCDFWLLGPLLPFLKGPPKLIKNGHFQK